MESIVVGIDLGTTYSAVAYFDEKAGEPKILDNKMGQMTTPSVVGIKQPSGQLVIGQSAKDQAVQNPELTVSEIKRHMGEELPNPAGGSPRPYTVKFDGRDCTPPEISAYVLRFLKDSAEERLNVPIEKAVITCPAHFNENQRNATIQAGKLAGLHVMRIINEPTAAAISYGLAKAELAETDEADDWGSEEPAEKQRVLIYDLGGGTFDVSIIEIFGRNVKVISTEGDSKLGGADFDEELTRWVLQKVKEQYGKDLSEERQARQRIRNEAEKVKINLSIQESETISLPYLTTDANGNPVSPQFELSRAEFEMLILPHLKRTIEKVNSALASKQLKASDLTAILLVGGSTKMPAVRRIIKSTYDVQPRTDIQPDLCVAQGAAVVAFNYRNVPVGEAAAAEAATAAAPETGQAAEAAAPTIGVHDVTGHSLGIKVFDSRRGRPIFERMIMKDTGIPHSHSNVFSTATDNQPSVEVCIYQGEDEDVLKNTLLRSFMLTDIPPLPAGQPQVRVTFNLDVNGTLTVIAEDLLTGHAQQVDYQYKGITQMSEDEFREKSSRLAALFEQMGSSAPSQPEGPQIPADYQAFWQKANTLLPNLDAEKQEKLRSTMSAFMEAIKSGNKEAIEEKGNDLSNVVMDVM